MHRLTQSDVVKVVEQIGVPSQYKGKVRISSHVVHGAVEIVARKALPSPIPPGFKADDRAVRRVFDLEDLSVILSPEHIVRRIADHIERACWTFENEPALRDGGRGLW